MWETDEDFLERRLVYRLDPDMPHRHGFVEPAARMRFEEYAAAIDATAIHWRRRIMATWHSQPLSQK